MKLTTTDVQALAARYAAMSEEEKNSLDGTLRVTMIMATKAVGKRKAKPYEYKFECEFCKKEFQTNDKHKVYCSGKCKKKFEKSRDTTHRPRRRCEHCKKDFPVIQPNQKFCSRLCRKQSVKTERTCKVCGTSFVAKIAKYCSDSCRLKDSNRPVQEVHSDREKCLQCGESLVGLRTRRKFCSAKCHKEHRRTKGQYVYAWYDGVAVFYVGRGVDNRATSGHGDQPCQRHRDSVGDNFSYKIVRDGLTDEGAMLVESVLIEFLRPICNVANGVSRKERPPLEVSSVLIGLASPEADPSH